MQTKNNKDYTARGGGSCESCEFYVYDEYTDSYTCSMNLDEDEFLEVERIPLNKAVDMVINGEIRDGKTQTLVLKVAEMQRRGIIGGGTK